MTPNEDIEQMREGVRYCPESQCDDGDVVYGVEVWDHHNDDSQAISGTETKSREQALDEFDETDEPQYDVVLFEACVDSTGDDVPDNLTVSNWPRHEEPVRLSDVTLLDRRPTQTTNLRYESDEDE